MAQKCEKIILGMKIQKILVSNQHSFRTILQQSCKWRNSFLL